MSKKTYFYKVIIFLFLFFCLLGLDLSTKFLAGKYLVRPYVKGERVKRDLVRELGPDGSLYVFKDISIVPQCFSLSYIRNFDIGFSLFTNLNILSHLGDEKLSKVVLNIQLLALVIVFFFFLAERLNYFYAFCFILAGGFGNVLNRYYNGYVIDFFKVGIPWNTRYVWPVFNVADSLVTIGAILFLLDIFRDAMKKRQSSKQISPNLPP